MVWRQAEGGGRGVEESAHGIRSAASSWGSGQSTRSCHEVVFLYAGELADPDIVPSEGGWFQDNGVPMFVEWRAVDDSGHEWPLYPGGAVDLARSLV